GAEGEAAAAGMAPRQPIGPGRQAQCSYMGRHMGAVGQKRHGVVGKAADDLDHHEQGRDDGGPFGARLSAGMTAAQKDMVARPDAMGMGIGGVIMVVMIVVMGMAMTVIVKAVPMGMIVRHGASLARSRRKIAL